MTIAALTVLSISLFLALCISVYYNYKFGIWIISTQEEIERSLDVLDERYFKMSEILKIPVFFDSVEVRQTIQEIKKSRDSVLLVANMLTSQSTESTDDKKEISATAG